MIPTRAFVWFLLVALAFIFCAFRFGPHLIWRTLKSDVSLGVVGTPVTPLSSEPPEFETLLCQVGRLTMEVPSSMREYRRKGRVVVIFNESKVVVIRPPNRYYDSLVDELPAKSGLLLPRLRKMILEASSSDFSFGMNLRELRWHQWLLESKHGDPRSTEFTADYVIHEGLEGIFTPVSKSVASYQWATVSGDWEGSITYHNLVDGTHDWMRHAAASLRFNNLTPSAVSPAVSFH